MIDGITVLDNANEILNKAIAVYGIEAQENVAIEELSELIQAICHTHRCRVNNIAEEIADCEIMLEQLKIINNCSDDVEKIKIEKLDRLCQRLSKVSVPAKTRDKLTVGQRIRKHRNKLGLSQMQLANELSVTQTSISCWEADKVLPSTFLLNDLAELFNISIDELLGR